jgi:hypothetical protein
MSKGISPALREAFLGIVQNQLRDNKPPETKATLERLMAERHSRERAMELISAVVAVEVVDIFHDNGPHNAERYLAGLRALPRLPGDED